MSCICPFAHTRYRRTRNSYLHAKEMVQPPRPTTQLPSTSIVAYGNVVYSLVVIDAGRLGDDLLNIV